MALFLTVLILAIYTMIPALELRFSIPMGFFTPLPAELDWWWVVTICILANVALGIGVYEVLIPILKFMRRWAWFEKKLWPIVEHRREKLRPVVEKHGEWGLALFIGVPLPGTGAVTGAAGAALLDFDRKRFYLANLAGVLLAGICVTAICLFIDHGMLGEDSWVTKLFIKAH